MAKQKNKEKIKNDTFETTTTSNLPGLNGIEVILPYTLLRRENSSKFTRRKIIR